MTGSCSLALALGLCSCQDPPPEPAPAPSAQPATPARSKDLKWQAPAAWVLEKDAPSGNYRARYSIPSQGDAKLAAELLVQRFTGPSQLEQERDYVVGLFEKTDGPKTETGTAGALDITWVEIAGDYKFPMGPPMGKTRKHSAHVIKNDWTALMALVKTPQHGHWFFRIVGPDDTVAAARSAFRSMIEALEPQ